MKRRTRNIHDPYTWAIDGANESEGSHDCVETGGLKEGPVLDCAKQRVLLHHCERRKAR
jgi:hypothetical protein